MIIIILLLSGATLAYIRFMLWSGTIEPLEGALSIFYNTLSFVFIFTLAAGVFLTVCVKPKQKDERLATTNTGRKEVKRMQERNNIRHWARLIIIGWIGILCIIVYVYMGIFIWRESVSPLVQTITTTQYNWFETDNLITLITTFMFTTLWIVMPAMMYWEVTSKPHNKGKKDE